MERGWIIVPSAIRDTGITYDSFWGVDYLGADYFDELSDCCEPIPAHAEEGDGCGGDGDVAEGES